MQSSSSANLFGLDVSEFQGDWDAETLRDINGVQFVIARAGVENNGGGQSTDSLFSANIQKCLDAGIPCGGYWFARPTLDFADAEDQADYFATLLFAEFGDAGEIFPVIDFETLSGGYDGTVTITQGLDWIDYFRTYFFDTYGRVCMLYTGRDFIADNNNFNEGTTGNPLKDMPLWVAAWSRFGYETVPDAGGWTQWQVWQYSDNGSVSAITDRFTNVSFGTGDGVTTVFTLPTAPIRRDEQDTQLLFVYIDGVEQEIGTDFSVTSYGAGQITFTSAPANGTDITATWDAEAVDLNVTRTSIDFLLVPPTPDNVQVVDDSSGRLLTWDNVDVDDLTAYNLYADSVYEATVFTNQYSIPYLENDTSYTVTAVDFYEQSPESSAVVVPASVDSVEKVDKGIWGYRIQPDNAPPLSFSRDSTAWDNNGVEYTANTPRFEAGQAGFGQAILLEDETTNRIPNGEGFLTSGSGTAGNIIADGWSAYMTGTANGIRGMDTINTTFDLPRSQRIVKQDGGADRWGITRTLTGISEPSTISVLMWVSALSAGGQFVINCDYYSGGGYVSTTNNTITATTGDFVRYDVGTETATIDEVRIFIWCDTNNGTANVQIVQEENLELGTTFIEETRETELLTGDPSDVFTFESTQEGTVSFWFYHSDNTRDAESNSYYLSTASSGTNDEFGIRFVKATTNFQFVTSDNGGTQTVLSTTDVADGWHMIHVTYDQATTTTELYMDGALVDSDASANLPSVFGSMYAIGDYYTGTLMRQPNTLLDNFVFRDAVLDSTAIGNEYSSGVPVPPDEDTMAVYNFEDDLTSGGYGQHITENIALTDATNVLDSWVWWVDVNYDGTITVESSIDDGSNWDVCTKGEAIPNVTGDMSSDTMKLRATLQSESGNDPKLINLYWNITYGDTIGGGQTFPMEVEDGTGFEVKSYDVEQVVFNNSNVSIPWVAKVYGEIINFEIQNLTTGKTLKMDSTVSTGEIMVIDTRFGQKSITQLISGSEVNKIGELDISVSEFWQLIPGENLIRFESSTNNNGAVIFTYREEKAGF